MLVAKFVPGNLFMTPGIKKKISQIEWQNALSRHFSCDWGELSDTDKRRNDQALHNGGRLFSSYAASDGTKFWVITEADRSATTILLPSEY